MTTAAQPTEERKRGTYRKQFIRDKTAPPPFTIQERDISIIQAVFENRFLTIPLLAQLFPPDENGRRRKGASEPARLLPYSNLYRRLSPLFHNGYLHRFRTVIGGDHIYAVDTKGVQILRDRQIPLPLPNEDWRLNKETPATLFVNHTLMVARFRVALQRALAEHPSLQLHSFEREGLDLKAEWRHNGQKVLVNPDAFFVLKDTSTDHYIAYFLEADRSTMQLSRLLKKYQDYSTMYQERRHLETFGIQNFNVLTICKSLERAGNLLTLVHADTVGETSKGKPIPNPIPRNHRSFFYFTTEEVYKDAPANVLATIWRRADDTPTDATKSRAIIAAPLART
jgi:hypothetical protein